MSAGAPVAEARRSFQWNDRRLPTVDERRTIRAPALVLGHRADLIHPFSDAEALVRQLPDARLVEAQSIVELRLHPGACWPRSSGSSRRCGTPGPVPLRWRVGSRRRPPTGRAGPGG